MEKEKYKEEIARVAYELFEKRGCVGGRHFDDWIEAERIVMARHAKQKTSPGVKTRQVEAKASPVPKPKVAASAAVTPSASTKTGKGTRKKKV